MFKINIFSFVLFFLLIATNIVHAESVPNPHITKISQELMKYDVLLDEEGDYQKQLELAAEIDATTPEIFYKCYGHEECVITAGACGENRVVSLHAKDIFDAAASIQGAIIDCAMVPNHYEDSARCLEQRCVLIHEMPSAE